MLYTGWNQGGLKILELTNPDYNPCMRRTANGGGFIGNDKNKINISVDARRTDAGIEGGATLNDHDQKAKIVVDKLASPSDTDTMGMPAAIVSGRSSLSWCTPSFASAV